MQSKILFMLFVTTRGFQICVFWDREGSHQSTYVDWVQLLNELFLFHAEFFLKLLLFSQTFFLSFLKFLKAPFDCLRCSHQMSYWSLFIYLCTVPSVMFTTIQYKCIDDYIFQVFIPVSISWQSVSAWRRRLSKAAFIFYNNDMM